MRSSTALATILLLLCSSDVLSDKMYKWRDDWGNVHYSHFKPEYYEAQELDSSALVPRQPEVTQPSPEQATHQSSQRPARPQQRENADIHAANCKNAKANLKQLMENPRIRIRNPDGSSAMMGEDQRQAKIKESRRQIEYFCN